MSKSIKCTNPNCGTSIPVPVGAMQVICTSCNTWHFPEPDETSSNNGDLIGSGAQYGLPPVMNDAAHDSEANDLYQSSAQPPMQPSAPPLANDSFGQQQEQQIFHDLQENSRRIEEQPIVQNFAESAESEFTGYLVTSTGVRLGLKEGKNHIGRAGSDLVIDDKTVSRKHCVVEVVIGNSGKQFIIYDQGHINGSSSTNGVFISGRSLRLQDYERIMLQNGSSITIGKVQLTLQA